jgi:hypothetical protein
LRRVVDEQVTATPQIDSEIAAPFATRTPMSTAAAAAWRVRMEAWRQRRESQPAESSPREGVEKQMQYRGPGAGGAPAVRMRRCLILGQGVPP